MTNEHFASDMDLGEPLLTAVQAVRVEPISDADVDRIEQQLLKMMSQSFDARDTRDSQTRSTRLVRPSGVRRAAWLSLSVVVAVLMIGFVTTFSDVSLADVLENASKQPWVHQKYSDGEETWTSDLEGKRFIKDVGGRIQLFDDRHFVWRQYLAGDDHITESRATKEQLAEIKRRNLTKTVLAELSPVPKGYKKTVASKQEKEIVDGRELLRIDLFRINALDQHVLEHQLWVDPETQLPLRSRRWMTSLVVGSTERSFVDGTFEFPESGPASIYELGVPAGLKIVRVGSSASPVTLSPDTDEILVGIKKAMASFPERFRLLVWPIIDEESPYSWGEGVDRIYWNGSPKRTERKGMFSPGLVDWSGVRIRQERFHLQSEGDQPKYISLGNYSVPESAVAFPKTAVEVETWLQDRTSDSPCVSDGVNAFAVSGHAKELQVTRINRGPRLSSIHFPDNQWPRKYQWPTLTYAEDGILNFTGDMEVMTSPPDAVPGTIALRLDSASGQRFDFYLDPAHDYICVKFVHWGGKDNSIVDRFRELRDLQQFPSGQWYATRIVTTTFSNGPKGRKTHVSKRALNIRLLEPDDFPPGTFDGQKLTDEAKKKGYKINAM